MLRVDGVRCILSLMKLLIVQEIQGVVGRSLLFPNLRFYFLSLMDRAGSYGLSDGVSITSGSVLYARSVMDTHGTSNPAYAGSSPVGHAFKHEQQLFPFIKI